MTDTLSLAGVFLEGLLSFFSPCVLPLIPLYIGYLTQDAQKVDDQGNVMYSRGKTMLLTCFFVLGICFVFFLAALGSSALRLWFTQNTILFQFLGGFLLILFGLFALGVINIPWLQKEKKMNFASKGKMSWLSAFLMGFFFSFAWSPCIGPLLASAIVMASNASSAALGFGYIAAYALGFIIMFLLLGLFTGEILNLLKKNKNIVKYTQIIGGIVILIMGGYMLLQAVTSVQKVETVASSSPTAETTTSEPVPEATSDVLAIQQYDFTLQNGDGQDVRLSDYQGKVIVVNFFGTWCPYCKQELPHLQEISSNQSEDVQVFLIATPNDGKEGSMDDVKQFMSENGYTMEVLYDNDFSVTRMYQVSGYPTTYIYKTNGEMLGYVPGYVDASQMDSYLQQAME